MALSLYEKELLKIVVSRAAGSVNDSVIDNVVRQVLTEKKEFEPGRRGYLKRRIGSEALKQIRERNRRGTRPGLVLTA